MLKQYSIKNILFYSIENILIREYLVKYVCIDKCFSNGPIYIGEEQKSDNIESNTIMNNNKDVLINDRLLGKKITVQIMAIKTFK